MTPLEVVTALVGGMDAADRAKVATLLGVSSKPAAAAPASPCRRLGHSYRISSPGGWFSGATMTCSRCGRTRQTK